MGFGSVRICQCGIGGMIFTLCAQPWLLAQEKAASPQPTAVSVPFIGCKSGGQVGSAEAPKGTSTSVPITAQEAQGLAYYESSPGFGVLAPRGWHCFGTYGSGGDALFVSPQPIDTAIFAPGWKGFAGPAIEFTHRFGGTFGRFAVAEVIARVFPAYRAFATHVMEFPAPQFAFGPYPKDSLTYKGTTVVEYKTPPQTEGLGTHSSLLKNGSPIEGVAILIGQTPDLLLLSVRLPPDLTGLTSAIVRQVESDPAHGPTN